MQASILTQKSQQFNNKKNKQLHHKTGILVNMLKKEKKKVTDFLGNPSMAKPPAYAGPSDSLGATSPDELYQKPKRQIRKIKKPFF